MNNELRIMGKIRKITKLGILVGLKETYLLTRNAYGLLAHPFLTTKRIMKDKDVSQGILVFGLPVYLWLGWIFVLLVSRIFIFGELRFGILAKSSFLLLSLTISFLLLFLVYWVFKVKGEK